MNDDKSRDTRTEAAAEKFRAGYNCAQSVLWPFSNELGLEADTALKIACGLGAGMGRRQDVCGAVTGGILVLGLRHGRGEWQDRSATEATYEKTRELMRRFEARYGTVKCRDLLGGCDLTTEEGRRLVKERGLHDRVCRTCVQTVVAILEELA